MKRPNSAARSLVAVVLALFVAGIALWTSATGASASCATQPDLDTAISQADVVVVGTVTETRSSDRIATVRVEDVWKGTVTAEIEVFGGPDSPSAHTSVDRTYRVGQRYLLFAYEPAAHGAEPLFGGRVEDNECSLTQPYTEELAVHRPAGAQAFTPSTVAVARTHSHWTLLIVLLTVAVAMVIAAGVRVRRRRDPHGDAPA